MNRVATALRGLETRLQATERPVALGPEGLLDGAALLQAAGQLATTLGPGGTWILATPDPFDFLAALLAVSARGGRVLLPPNHLPATLLELAPGTDGLVTGIPAGPSAPLGPLQEVELVFWTSGSGGGATAVPRRFSHLLEEVQVLEALFGPRLGDGPVLATVPHHHIYGCLFRVLWPLMAGRPFATATGGDPESAPWGAPVLVSSPAHLSRALRLVELHAGMRHASVVFCSGGPLPRADALAWGRWVAGGVVEVYGSTETGGIAWRIQDGAEGSDLWRPFPDVAVGAEPDGALRLDSPRVTGGTQRLEDGIQLNPDGRFRLTGRLDRVVKVEEKRVSLPELEAALRAHPLVREAALTVLEGPRRALGAVVVVDTPPEAPADRRALAQTLRGSLGERFDAVLLPRRWRFVTELPVDARGKVTPASLAPLFQEPAP